MNKKHITSPLIRERVRETLWKDDISCRKLVKIIHCSKDRAREILYDQCFYLEADDIRAICIKYKVNPSWLLGLEDFNL